MPANGGSHSGQQGWSAGGSDSNSYGNKSDRGSSNTDRRQQQQQPHHLPHQQSQQQAQPFNPLQQQFSLLQSFAGGMPSATVPQANQAQGINSLQAMLQQLQQQQQQQAPSPGAQSGFTSQSQTALGASTGLQTVVPPFGAPNALLNPQALAAFGSPSGVAGGMAGLQQAPQGAGSALNMTGLTPLQQAQLQQLQQAAQQQQLQQQQQLARLLAAALMPTGLQGLGVGNPLINAATLGLPGAAQIPSNSVGGALDPRGTTQSANGSYQQNRPTGTDSRVDHRDRRRDHSADDRDRKGSRRDRSRDRDRSRSPNRRDGRRDDRRRSYRSDSDSEDERSRRMTSSSGGRDRSRDRSRPESPSRRAPTQSGAHDIPPGPLKTRHLWLGELPRETTEEDIRREFSRHGRISEIRMLPLKRGKASCFLAFATKAAATRCNNSQNLIFNVEPIIRMNARFIGQPDPDEDEERHPPLVSRRSLEPGPGGSRSPVEARSNVKIVERSTPVDSFAQRPRESERGPPFSRAPYSRRGDVETPSLYLPMVPTTLDQQELEREMAPFGSIESVRVIPGKFTTHSMAFVNFRTIEAAKRAFTELNGKIRFGSPHPLKIEFAQSSSSARRPPPVNGGSYTSRPGASADGPAHKLEMLPDSPVVIMKNFSQRLSGLEISENLNKLLATKYARAKINLFDIGSLEECHAVVQGLREWEADAVVRDLANLEFFGSPLSVQLSTYAQAVTKRIPSKDIVEPRPAAISDIRFIQPHITYQLVEDQIAWNNRPQPVIVVGGLPTKDTADAIVRSVVGLTATPLAWTVGPISGDAVSASSYLLYPNGADARQALEEIPRVCAPLTAQPGSFSSSLIRIQTSSKDKIPQHELTRVFSRYGAIAEQLYTPENVGSSDERDVIYIRYENVAHATRAVSAMNGETVGGYPDDLLVTFFDPRALGVHVPGNEHHGDEEGSDGEEEMEILETFVVSQAAPAPDGSGATTSVPNHATSPAVKFEGTPAAPLRTEPPDSTEMEWESSQSAGDGVGKQEHTGTQHGVMKLDDYEEKDEPMDVDSPPSPAKKESPAFPTFATIMGLKSKLTNITIHPLAGSTAIFESYLPEAGGVLKLSQRFQMTPVTLGELAQKLRPDASNWVLALCTPNEAADSTPATPTTTGATGTMRSMEQFMAIDRYFRDRMAAGMAVVQPRASLANKQSDNANPASVSIVPLSEETRAPFAEHVREDAQGMLMIFIAPVE
ncbi:hypothetical protein HDU87_007397 [Geranomyces variabilis]|uniref:RRM domain-containing protein n=1 Tax=Geranomyces variabilis TaxID=109894 RepID=A0AAD5XSS2_9FUNG|nr:hypothetical protein HDU87_007397 [Geranomyces variabilis]